MGYTRRRAVLSGRVESWIVTAVLLLAGVALTLFVVFRLFQISL